MRRSPNAPARLARPCWLAIPEWFLRLYRRPWLLIATLLGTPLLVTSLWLYVVNEHAWRAREGRDLLVAARLAARLIQEELTQSHAIEAAMAARPAFRKALKRRDRAALTSHLELLLDVTPMIDRAAILDAARTPLVEVTASSSERPDPMPPGHASAAASDPPWPPPVSGVYLRDQASGEKAVEVSSLVHDGDATLGVLQVQYRLQELSRWFEQVRIERSGFLYLVDRRGRLVAYPFQLVPGQPKDVSGWAPVAEQASARGTLVRFAQGRPPRPWTAAVVALEPFGWRVVAQQPDAEMLEPFRRLVASFVLLTAVLIGFVSWLVTRWARLHQATLQLVAQQARLLRSSEQRRLRAKLHQSDPETEHPDHAD